MTATLTTTPRGTGSIVGAGPRIEFFARCAALEDLDHRLRTGRAEYAEAARRSTPWLFPA